MKDLFEFLNKQSSDALFGYMVLVLAIFYGTGSFILKMLKIIANKPK